MALQRAHQEQLARRSVRKRQEFLDEYANYELTRIMATFFKSKDHGVSSQAYSSKQYESLNTEERKKMFRSDSKYNQSTQPDELQDSEVDSESSSLRMSNILVQEVNRLYASDIQERSP